MQMLQDFFFSFYVTKFNKKVSYFEDNFFPDLHKCRGPIAYFFSSLCNKWEKWFLTWVCARLQIQLPRKETPKCVEKCIHLLYIHPLYIALRSL